MLFFAVLYCCFPKNPEGWNIASKFVMDSMQLPEITLYSYL